MSKMLVLDVDLTLVDSSIRENECWYRDTLDLDIYLSLKSEGIVYDTLLPLGHWVENNAKTLDFCLVTSRLFDKEDWQSLFRLMPKTLRYACEIVSRNNADMFGSSASIQCSALYKKPVFKSLQVQFCADLLVIDDCHNVLDIALQDGHSAIDARDLWHLSHKEIEARLYNALT